LRANEQPSKTPSDMFEPGPIPLAAELAFNISNKTIFLTRPYQAIRVRKTFCHHAGDGYRGELGKR